MDETVKANLERHLVEHGQRVPIRCTVWARDNVMQCNKDMSDFPSLKKGGAKLAGGQTSDCGR